MEGQKEFRRRITKLNGRTNSSENNTFVRIQNKVRALLQSRNRDLEGRAQVSSGNTEETLQPNNATAAIQVHTIANDYNFGLLGEYIHVNQLQIIKLVSIVHQFTQNLLQHRDNVDYFSNSRWR